jgi:hypothetical protein
MAKGATQSAVLQTKKQPHLAKECASFHVLMGKQALAVLSFFALSAWAAPPGEIRVRISDFSAVNRWDSFRVTDLKVNQEWWDVRNGPPTRQRFFETLDSHISYNFEIAGPKLQLQPMNKLPEMERAALLRMVQEGYITKQLYDAVIALPPSSEPRQVFYVEAYTSLSLTQARRLFDGKIPWERVRGKIPKNGYPAQDSEAFAEWRDRLWPAGEPLEVSQASVMVIRGQSIDPISGAYRQQRMPWQIPHAMIPSPLVDFDAIKEVPRSTFPLVAELKRAHAEKGPLPGTLDSALIPALGMLRSEARTHRVPPERYAIFSECLSEQKAVYFQKAFATRLWDREAAILFQDPTPEVLASWGSSETRRDVPERSVLMATLGRLDGLFHLEEHSARALEIRRRSHGKLSFAQAHEVLALFEATSFSFFRVPEQKEPLCVWNCTPLSMVTIVDPLVNAGIETEEYNAILEYINSLGAVNHQAFSEIWNTPGIVVPTEKHGPNDYRQMFVRLDNVSLDLALRETGEEYLARVIVAVYDHTQDRYSPLSALANEVLKDILGQLGQEKNPSPRHLLSLFPIRVASSTHALTERLLALGGVRHDAVLAFSEVSLTGMVSNGGGAALVAFTPETIETLRLKYSILQAQSGDKGCTRSLERLSQIQNAAQY